MTETELISALKEGQQSALAALYDRYGNIFYGIALRIVQSPELAEEITQEAFLKIWRNISQFDESKGRLFTWAFNIARNTAVDFTRRSDFRQTQKTDNFDFLVYQETHPATETQVETIGLREMVSRLDEKYRRVIDLAYFQGFTQTEIEKELNIPVGTVKTRLRLALRELRRILKVENG